MRSRTLGLGLVVIFGLGCQLSCQNFRSKTAGELPPQPPRGYKPAPLQLLGELGESEQPQFSPDGQRLLFISRNRPQHRNSQVYEYNFQSQRQRRLTFQDGDLTSPSYHPRKDQLLYSSTTDEIKEDPAYLKQTLSRLAARTDPEPKTPEEPILTHPWSHQPFEIYISGFRGENIQRLTHSPGFDAHADMHPLKDEFVFSSLRSGVLQVYRQELGQRRAQPLRPSPDHHQLEPRHSPSGEQLLFVEMSKDMKSSQIFLQKEPGAEFEPLTEGPFIHWNPGFSPDGRKVLFSSNRGDGRTFEIYSLEIATGCLKRLTYSRDNQTHPHWSPDGEKIALTADTEGRPQIYLMAYRPPKNCDAHKESQANED